MNARSIAPWLSAVSLAAAGMAIVATTSPGPAMAADRDHPAVVELFQSQGCSSCPPANANVMAIADRPDVLTLSWQVTYWDDLGWKDTFDSPAFTARQWDYAHAFHRAQVATPEVVVNGRADVVGNRRDELETLIRHEDRGLTGPQVSFTNGHVAVSAGTGRGEVVLVRYDPNIVQVPIQRGENGGRTLPHRNVVREVVRLGDWSGTAQTYALPAPTRAGLKTAVLVQAGVGGPILAAGRG
ncbi:thioredoxin family protein [Caulobacter sp. S45]|jgi:hypothetical protein|uniref:DUF1223 domain-containing protein n=1 Tax=Caulobacter sp. S45 TaxID=1641861 RepID=UPI00131D2B15|nr:DUF1223 domain-containing protein [Caulobacter sp. S45]